MRMGSRLTVTLRLLWERTLRSPALCSMLMALSLRGSAKRQARCVHAEDESLTLTSVRGVGRRTWERSVSVTLQPLRERTLWSSTLRSVEIALRLRSSGTIACASFAYSRSMLIPANFIFMTGTNESTTGCSSVTSGSSCTCALTSDEPLMQEVARADVICLSFLTTTNLLITERSPICCMLTVWGRLHLYFRASSAGHDLTACILKLLLACILQAYTPLQGHLLQSLHAGSMLFKRISYSEQAGKGI